MNNEWNVQNFLNQLRNAQPQPRTNEQKSPTLRKTYLALTENLGRYQIFPMISTVTGMPFEYLYKTREVNIVTGKNQDGTDRSAWHKLLPVSAYDFVDNTNRRVSSLTQAEHDLLESAYGVFDKMWEVIPESQRKDYCRIKNYTVGNAHVINRYGLKDQTKPIESNFDTLLVCTSKDFANAINKDIEMQMINFGNDPSFLGQIYNRQLEGRTGWLIFNIQTAANGIGYSVSASHTANLNPMATEGLVITKEGADLMTDPVRAFLGWQAGKEKLFNEQLITNIIEEMNKTISKYVNSAVYVDNSQMAQATVATAQPAPAAPTNDPMMAAFNQQQSQMSAPTLTVEEQMAKNDNPFVTPPAAQFDPMSGVPNNYGNPQQGYGYQQPQFAQNPPQFTGDQQGSMPPYSQPQFAQRPQVANPFDTAESNPYKQ